MRELPEPLGAVGRFVAALAVTVLAPRRLWSRWDLPVASASTVAALVMFMSGFALAIPGYLDYAARASAAVVEGVFIQGPGVDAGRLPAVGGTYAVSLASMLAFALFTPRGWLSLYLAITGFYRALAVVAGDVQGDPVIGLVDGVLVRRRDRLRAAEAAAVRAAQEGTEVPDVRLGGTEGGAPEAVWVVVSSRVKPGWEEGTFVMTPDAWFRLGRPFDRRYPDGMRRVYPLIVPGAAEVIRRQVAYELPELSACYPGRPRVTG